MPAQVVDLVAELGDGLLILGGVGLRRAQVGLRPLQVAAGGGELDAELFRLGAGGRVGSLGGLGAGPLGVEVLLQLLQPAGGLEELGLGGPDASRARAVEPAGVPGADDHLPE